MNRARCIWPSSVRRSTVCRSLWGFGPSSGDTFSFVRVPAGKKPARAFRIDENQSLESQLTLQAVTFTHQDIELVAEQYRFGK